MLQHERAVAAAQPPGNITRVAPGPEQTPTAWALRIGDSPDSPVTALMLLVPQLIAHIKRASAQDWTR